MNRTRWARWTVRLAILAVALIGSAMLVEYLLEARDFARYTQEQTFAAVGDARIRYQLLGTENQSSDLVVLLQGIASSIEKVDELQRALSAKVQVLTYDRAGYGFSQGSTAHDAVGQAEELRGLLDALKVKNPVVLVGYSAAGPIARVFASRYPDKVAAVYLLEPTIPESDQAMPNIHGPRRSIARGVVQKLVASSLGLIRIAQSVTNWNRPRSAVELRLDAIDVSRSQYWAVAREWYLLGESWRQTLAAPLPPNLRLVIVTTNSNYSAQFAKLYAELAARSSRGDYVELNYVVDHGDLTKPGPAFDSIVAGIEKLARADAEK
jgi:pimeloyl-ACP methyl ester carboxylesterase